MDNTDYILEFEEILKLKEFNSMMQKNENYKEQYFYTLEMIRRALKDDFINKIDEKITRWANVTRIYSFENAEFIKYYFQAKMLYRDGFYESAIMLVRSICEMVCYDLLSRISHPFGNLALIDVLTFRVFLNFLAIPKKIDKDDFENKVIANIANAEDKNFIKSSYEFDSATNIFTFKNEIGRKNKNLERIFDIFKAANFDEIEMFSKTSYTLLHKIYDIGNLYIHAKEKSNPAKDDAIECLNMLTHILSEIYAAKSLSDLQGKTITSAYAGFPDICKGINFGIGLSESPLDAMLYYFPKSKYRELLKTKVGTWKGKWKDSTGKIINGILTFTLKSEECIYAKLKYTNENNEEINEPMDIKLFDNYLHLKGFDENDMKHKKEKHVFFELEFFSENLLIGENLNLQGKVLFERKNAK